MPGYLAVWDTLPQGCCQRKVAMAFTTAEFGTSPYKGTSGTLKYSQSAPARDRADETGQS